MNFRISAMSVVLCALAALTISPSSDALVPSSAKDLGLADQDSIAHFNVYLPLTHTDVLATRLAEQTDPGSPNYHRWFTPQQFKEQFGPKASDVAKMVSAMEFAGFTVVAEKTQSIEFEGPVSAVERTFGTAIHQIQTEKGVIKLAATEGSLKMPGDLASIGATVPEFTGRFVAHVHSRRVGRSLLDAQPGFRLSSTSSFYYPNDLNEAYQLPSFRTKAETLETQKTAQIAGVGAHIGIVISSKVSQDDVDSTFNSSIPLSNGANEVQAYSKYSNLPVPKVKFRLVNGGSGTFDPASEDAAEASLDTQMSLGTAPGAKETVYDIPDLSDENIADAYSAINEDNAVDVVSSSFGECELDFTPAYNGGTDYTYILNIFHQLFEQGNAQGITFVASSGDNGGVPCVSASFAEKPRNGTSFVKGVENPADDPDVTAVGGTNLETIAAPTVNDAQYEKENASFDPRYPASYQISASEIVTVKNNTWGSGGGYSAYFARPDYQKPVKTGSSTHRAVPDVAMMMGGCPADANLSAQNCTVLPRSSAIIWIGGNADLLIGTSSAAPEIAGVLALAVGEAGGRLGNVNPVFYVLSAMQTLDGGAKAPPEFQFFHRDVTGDNNPYKVKPGDAYTPVLGNGTLDVKNFLGLSLAAPSGTPNSKSNP